MSGKPCGLPFLTGHQPSGRGVSLPTGLQGFEQGVTRFRVPRQAVDSVDDHVGVGIGVGKQLAEARARLGHPGHGVGVDLRYGQAGALGVLPAGPFLDGEAKAVFPVALRVTDADVDGGTEGHGAPCWWDVLLCTLRRIGDASWCIWTGGPQ